MPTEQSWSAWRRRNRPWRRTWWLTARGRKARALAREIERLEEEVSTRG